MTDPTADLPPPPAPSPAWAFFLDFDGTLVDLAATPDGIDVDGVSKLLDGLLRAAGGAVALVTGRTIDNLDARIGGARTAVAGLHGLERRIQPGTPIETEPDSQAIAALRGPLHAIAGDFPGVSVEDKGAAIALHYRQAPEVVDPLGAAVHALADGMAGITVLRGNHVFEVKPTHANKGHAVSAFMAAPPFAGRMPVFIGDDVTDEDGFAAVNGAGGLSVRCGNRTPTTARFSIASVSGVRSWLSAVGGAGT